jgi:murein DD-endopeptidase MepM/ murein hydrolase activator NlpD
MKYYKVRKLKRVRLKRKRSKKPLWVVLVTCSFFACTFFYFWGEDFSGPIMASVSPRSPISAKKDLSAPENSHPAGGATQALESAGPNPEEDPGGGEKPAREEEVEVQEGAIRSGQTITSLLGEYLDPARIYKLARVCSDVFPVQRIKSGQVYRIKTVNGEFKGFEYEINDNSKLCVQVGKDGFTASKKDIVYEVDKVLVQAEIEDSLFLAAKKIGESAALPVRLAQIFAWDVDFVKDIRKGDSFRALIEKRYRKGEFSGYGRILAARFENKGKIFNAFLFQESGGRCDYYDENGDSVRKAFLKAPLEFSRISSGYSRSRLHPILKVRRPHRAIDYAAPRGTPIKSIGDGKVVAKSYAKGAGRYVKVRHNSIYTTVYNHMSRFARGLHVGKTVSQGETIGYVGATGYATGPHLDFRMKKNGQYVNPLHVKSPPVEPVPKEDMPRFKMTMEPLMAALEGETRVAGNSNSRKARVN